MMGGVAMYSLVPWFPAATGVVGSFFFFFFFFPLHLPLLWQRHM